MKVTIITNLPCLSATLWGPNLSRYDSRPTSSNLIAQYRVDGKDEETVGEITFDDIPKGLYEVRLHLPYYNSGEQFDMIIVMNKVIFVDRDITLSFKANLSEEV